MNARPLLLVVAAVLLAACSATPLQPELADAEAHERAGRHEQALEAYSRSAARCHKVKNVRQRYETCRAAVLGRAELLDRLGRRLEAAAAYERTPEVLADHEAACAEALYRAGKIYAEEDRREQANRLLWRTVTDYPNEDFATDALKLLLRDGRASDWKALNDKLTGLSKTMRKTAIADNLYFAMAEIAEKDANQISRAREYLDVIANRYAKYGLADDALWHGARLSKELGDWQGAVDRLRKLQDTREVSWGGGSYFSVWLDNGQLELGLIFRDHLNEPRKAAQVFRELHELYPDSVLRDDARFQEALSWKAAGDRARACKALDKLRRKHPNSKFRLHKAPALRTELGC